MASAGLGALASSIVTGWLFDQFGVNSAFLAGGIGALALGLATMWILPSPSQVADVPHLNPTD
jgi:MFS family permease